MRGLHTFLDSHAVCDLLCFYHGFHILEFCVDSGAKVTVEVNICMPTQKMMCKKCSCSEIVSKGDDFTTTACRMINVAMKCCGTCIIYTMYTVSL